ncbi:hypothetical protein T02_11337 [Trichinella nativa]|uniref:Uncharacterized protein n=1 Tax=Trichinella nativa TaxID=6335 RepID=A0A0V1KJN9_9BILA|nr:hypothetical protein T02_11337 [Trichinella nativa]
MHDRSIAIRSRPPQGPPYFPPPPRGRYRSSP